MIIEDGVLVKIENGDIDSDGHCVVPYGVTAIGNDTFYKSSVKSVIIPNSVTNIGESAFCECKQLNKITIPCSVTRTGYDAFSGCDSLKEVHISDLTAWCNINFGYFGNPLYYAHDLYLNGELIKELIIPDDITTIKISTFEGGSFEHIKIPKNVTGISSFAFLKCDSLKSITIPKSVNFINDKIFALCSSLSKVIIEGNLKTVGFDIFSDCKSLKEVVVCSNVLRFSLEASNDLPSGCKIITDKTLLKDKDISLGTDFLSGSTTGDSNYEAESSSKEFKRNKVLFKDIDKGDEL